MIFNLLLSYVSVTLHYITGLVTTVYTVADRGVWLKILYSVQSETLEILRQHLRNEISLYK